MARFRYYRDTSFRTLGQAAVILLIANESFAEGSFDEPALAQCYTDLMFEFVAAQTGESKEKLENLSKARNIEVEALVKNMVNLTTEARKVGGDEGVRQAFQSSFPKPLSAKFLNCYMKAVDAANEDTQVGSTRENSSAGPSAAFSSTQLDFDLICNGSRTTEYFAVTRDLKNFHKMLGAPDYELQEEIDLNFFLKIEKGVLVKTDAYFLEDSVGQDLLVLSEDVLTIRGGHPGESKLIPFSISRNTGRFGPSYEDGEFRYNNLVETFSAGGFKLSYTYDVKCEKNTSSF